MPFGNDIPQKIYWEIGIPPNLEAYIQSRVLKKTLKSISFDRRRNLVEGNELEKVEESVKRLAMTYTGRKYKQLKKYLNDKI